MCSEELWDIAILLLPERHLRLLSLLLSLGVVTTHLIIIHRCVLNLKLKP